MATGVPASGVRSARSLHEHTDAIKFAWKHITVVAPPAGSYLSRGGPGGHCQYLWTRVPPLAVSRLVWLSVITPKGAEQPDPRGPTPSHRTNGPGPASRSRAGPVSPRVPKKGALSQNSRGGARTSHRVPDPIHYPDPLAGREQTPRLRGSGAATCLQVR